MRRVTRPVLLALLVLAIGVAVAILATSSGCPGPRPIGVQGDGLTRATEPAEGPAAGLTRPPPSVLAPAPGPGGARLPNPRDSGDVAATATDATRTPRTVRILGPDGAIVPFARVGVLLPRPASERMLGTVRFESFLDVTDGVFVRLDPERSGTTYVVFDAAATRDAPPFGHAVARFRPDAATPIDAEVRLVAGLTIEGRVEDGEGRGLDGIVVRAHPVEAQQMRPELPPTLPLVLAEARCDVSGRFVLRGLGADPVLVVARTLGMLVEPDASAIVPGGARDVRLVLRAGREVRVTVLDPAGRPLVGALVATGAPGTRTAAGGLRVGARSVPGAAPARTGAPPAGGGMTFTNREGVALLVGLDPSADVTLRVTPGPTRSDLRPIVLPRWRPADSTLRLEAALRLRGRVLLPDGSSAPPALIEQFDGARWVKVGSTRKDGTFELEGLPSGPWTLRAVLFASTRVGPEVVVADESIEVRLVFPEAAPGPR